MRKVAIYARVSTEHEAQLSALENQVQYYDNLLQLHPEWELVERYIDEGITGTSVKKRKSFMRMLADAEKGMFDLIVTREVSRFARNTVDTLQETRKLKRLGVEVYFTEDNIWTMNDEDGELRLTIMATLAQNESKKTSLRVKAGQMVSFQNAVPYGNGNILGYDKVGREMVINPEQAETVKMIFDLFLDGYGEKAIQYELEKRGRKTSTGQTKWFASNIGRVLRNSFYCGTIVYRKEFVPDFLEQKKIKNYGCVENVVVEGSHEPIISKEVFEKVQEKLEQHRIVCKAQAGKTKICGRSGVERMTVWSKKLVCQCGTQMQRCRWNSSKSAVRKSAYQCYSSIKTGTVEVRERRGLSTEGICTTPMVPQWKLELAFTKVYERFIVNLDRVVEKVDDMLDYCLNQVDEDDNENVIEDKEAKLEKLKRKLDNLVEMRLNEEISRDMYTKRKQLIESEIDQLEAELEILKNKYNKPSQEDIRNRLLSLQFAVNRKIEDGSYILEDGYIDALVKQIVVCDDRLIFVMNDCKNGASTYEVENSKKKRCSINLSDDINPSHNQPYRLLLQQNRRKFY